MPLKEKHTCNFLAAVKFFNKRNDTISLLLAIAFLFILSQGYASDQQVEKVLTADNSTIIYSTGNSNDVVIITDGKITAAEGKTIRLLPGTHIKRGEQLTVNIASKECQDAVAQEVSKAKEEVMLTSAANKRDEVITEEHNTPTTAPFGFCSLPVGNSTINQQRTELVAYLATSSFSFHAPVLYLLRSSDNSFITHNSQLTTRLAYLPVFSWGDRAETIKVMRC